jgi:hypothetical protein
MYSNFSSAEAWRSMKLLKYSNTGSSAELLSSSAELGSISAEA